MVHIAIIKTSIQNKLVRNGTISYIKLSQLMGLRRLKVLKSLAPTALQELLIKLHATFIELLSQHL